MSKDPSPIDLTERARAAASGDQAAAREVLDALADDIYELALRMLGHPADAEDAAQEILVVVLTHLSSFRGESAFKTWVWRIAVNHLARVRRGRRETITFETLDDRLRTGLREAPSERPDPEAAALAAELRLRCTEAMILGLDRELRVAHVLADIFGLPGEVCAEILQVDPATFRKRLSRARLRLHEFLRAFCGVFDPANPCRCAGQVDAAIERGLLAPEDLYLTKGRKRPTKAVLDRAAEEVGDLMRLAEVLRGPSRYAAPDALVKSLRSLIESQRLELLRGGSHE
jgi:RNA polymerase sigma factor (sigma-70 family)